MLSYNPLAFLMADTKITFPLIRRGGGILAKDVAEVKDASFFVDRKMPCVDMNGWVGQSWEV